jgi:hypothetical protein
VFFSPTGNKNNIFFEGGLNLLYRYFSTGRYSKKTIKVDLTVFFELISFMLE